MMPKIRRRTFFGALAGLAATSAFGNNVPAENSSSRMPPGEVGTSALVLGTAQDGGYPHIGCYCPNCQRARKNPASARQIASIALLDHKEKKAFLIDCTPDIRNQYDRIHKHIKIDEVRRSVPDGILLSHAHIGHYTGLIFYGYEALSANKLPVYATNSMTAFLKGNGPWDQLITKENIELRPLNPSQPLKLTEEITVIPFPVPHRDEYSDTLGFIIEGKRGKLLYIPDIRGWDHWDRDIASVCRDVDHALLDGTFFSPDELPGRDLSKIGHPFIVDSMKRLHKGTSTTKICFTHLNHSNPALDKQGAAFREILNRGFCVAEEGMKFSI
jgi:pyrroloquinoline quinone biosynthesis protein B